MNLKKLVVIVFVCLSWISLAHADTLPDNFPGITSQIYNADALADGYIFMDMYTSASGIGHYIAILDNNGTPIWYQEVPDKGGVDFKSLPNGLLHYAQMFYSYSYTGGASVMHKILDNNYNEIESIVPGNGYTSELHDFQLLPNGHVLLTGFYLTQVDMSQYVDGGQPGALVNGTIIQELDWQRNVVFQWRSWDHDSMKTWFDTGQTVPNSSRGAYVDAYHVNTVNMDHDGNLIIGTPTWVKKIDRQTGDILWELGGPGNQFTFVGVTPEEGVAHFGGHNCHRLDNGHVLIYDNGSGSVSSSAHEYSLDEVNKVATLVWTYTPSPEIVGASMGNVQRLSNGNTLISWGGTTGAETTFCTEVTPDGEKVMELKFDQANKCYRVYKFIYPPQQQAIESVQYELAVGNTYDFGATGVTINVLDLSGNGYNELNVVREPYAPLSPGFFGQSPRVLPCRIKLEPDSIDSIVAQITIDTTVLSLSNPENLTVYQREFPGMGLFMPVPTQFDSGTNSLQAQISMFGELIFGYPDQAEIVYPPLLQMPEANRGDQTSGLVIAPLLAEAGVIYPVCQERPVSLAWSPKGFGHFYNLQIATNPEFDNPMEISWITEARYLFDSAQPDTTYYYRVQTINEAGMSDWSTGAFITVPPVFRLTAPNGGQWIIGWTRYNILWESNYTDPVRLELYRDGVFDRVIYNLTSIPNVGVYSWFVNRNLPTENKYSIKLVNTVDENLFDFSDAPFIINNNNSALGDYDLDGDVDMNDYALMSIAWLGQVAQMGDLNDDGNVDGADLAILVQNWIN